MRYYDFFLIHTRFKERKYLSFSLKEERELRRKKKKNQRLI